MVRARFFSVDGFVRLPAFMLTSVFALISASFLYASQPAGGTITIITVPERAEVWIDNNYAGLTPIKDKRLAAGTYTLRLVDPVQQKSTSETVDIADGERLLIERSLAGSYGRLRIDTDPQGADVAIIAELGKTPLINDYLTPGQYRLEIKHPDAKYLPAIKDVSFADGQPVSISHTLEKPPIFTKKRLIQMGLGAGSILGWSWALVEQRNTSKLLEKSNFEVDDDEYEKLLDDSKNAGIRRTAAIVAAASLSVALQVTIFIW